MAPVCLTDADILDEFNKGCWLLLNTGGKTDLIQSGTQIHVRDRKALVDEIIFGRRENRLALRVRYVSEHNENVASSPLLATTELVDRPNLSQAGVEGS